MENRLTQRINIQIPLIQAPMAGGATTPELVAAVSNAGGLGSLGAGYMAPEALAKAISEIKALTDQPFNVNLFVPNSHFAMPEEIESMRARVNALCSPLGIDLPLPQLPYARDFEAQLAVVLDEQVPVFSFTFGIPEEKYLKQLKAKKIKLLGTATSLAEAQALEKAQVDVIVAQSKEAGGHRGTFIGKEEDSLIGSSELIAQLVKACQLPVVASGGIMNVQQAQNVMKLGAAGVQLGTAFLTCFESGAPEIYKQALLQASTDMTVLTRAFSGRLARGLNNYFIEQMQKVECLPYPIQNALTKPMRQAGAQQKNPEFMSLWAGQGVGLCRTLSAGKLLEDFRAIVSKAS